jgi:hypothetical protein
MRHLPLNLPLTLILFRRADRDVPRGQRPGGEPGQQGLEFGADRLEDRGVRGHVTLSQPGPARSPGLRELAATVECGGGASYMTRSVGAAHRSPQIVSTPAYIVGEGRCRVGRPGRSQTVGHLAVIA